MDAATKDTVTNAARGAASKKKHVEQLFDGPVWVTFDKGVACPDPVDTVHLTDEHKAIIRRTWAPLKENLVDCGTRVFIRIFEVAPRIRAVFQHLLGDEAELASNDGLQMHATRFMQAVDTAITDLDNLSHRVVPMFVNLGRHHVHFRGLKETDFDGFSGAILCVWHEDIGEEFTPDVRAAWGRLIDFLIQHLKFGFAIARDAAVAKESEGSG